MAPTSGTARSAASALRPLVEPSFAIESAKAQAKAAQRAYMMASLAAGVNPMNDPVG
ncbi:MAG: hypothetical protein WAT09_19630 [Paracoccaceae bacterium]